MKYRKVYVSVKLRVSAEGKIRPLSFVWEDGEIYRIEKILAVTPAASLCVGGRGNRYTVLVCGNERNLFDEDGRWFLEAEC